MKNKRGTGGASWGKPKAIRVWEEARRCVEVELERDWYIRLVFGRLRGFVKYLLVVRAFLSCFFFCEEGCDFNCK